MNGKHDISEDQQRIRDLVKSAYGDVALDAGKSCGSPCTDAGSIDPLMGAALESYGLDAGLTAYAASIFITARK